MDPTLGKVRLVEWGSKHTFLWMLGVQQCRMRFKGARLCRILIEYCVVLYCSYTAIQFSFQLNFSLMFNHSCNLPWMGTIFPYLHMVKAVLAKHIHWYTSSLWHSRVGHCLIYNFRWSHVQICLFKTILISSYDKYYLEYHFIAQGCTALKPHLEPNWALMKEQELWNLMQLDTLLS